MFRSKAATSARGRQEVKTTFSGGREERVSRTFSVQLSKQRRQIAFMFKRGQAQEDGVIDVSPARIEEFNRVLMNPSETNERVLEVMKWCAVNIAEIAMSDTKTRDRLASGIQPGLDALLKRFLATEDRTMLLLTTWCMINISSFTSGPTYQKFFESGAIQKVLACMSHEDEEVRANCVFIIGNMASSLKKARILLVQKLDVVTHMKAALNVIRVPGTKNRMLRAIASLMKVLTEAPDTFYQLQTIMPVLVAGLNSSSTSTVEVVAQSLVWVTSTDSRAGVASTACLHTIKDVARNMVHKITQQLSLNTTWHLLTAIGSVMSGNNDGFIQDLLDAKIVKVMDVIMKTDNCPIKIRGAILFIVENLLACPQRQHMSVFDSDLVPVICQRFRGEVHKNQEATVFVLSNLCNIEHDAGVGVILATDNTISSLVGILTEGLVDESVMVKAIDILVTLDHHDPHRTRAALVASDISTALANLFGHPSDKVVAAVNKLIELGYDDDDDDDDDDNGFYDGAESGGLDMGMSFFGGPQPAWGSSLARTGDTPFDFNMPQ